MEHNTEVYSKDNLEWDFEREDLWVGGHWWVENESKGFHGILKQWWDYYTKENPSVLLVSEGLEAKKCFEKEYPTWNIETIDKYQKADIVDDICSRLKNKYDLIICQALLEHIYNPYGAMASMLDALNYDGILVLQTHAPIAGYHQHPRDYFRFMKDWWYDLPEHFKVELLEFYMKDNCYVFVYYRRIK